MTQMDVVTLGDHDVEQRGYWDTKRTDDINLLLGADDGIYGAELWVITPPPAAAEPTPLAALPVAIERVLPNPASSVATAVVTLRDAQRITLEVMDPLGREIARVDLGVRPAGRHTVPIEVRPLAPGLYVVRTSTPVGTATARLVVVPR